MKDSYNEIKLEVDNFLNEVESNNEISKALDKYYKGTRILFSNLLHRPKFMFIGINPGSGDKEKRRNLGIQKDFELSLKKITYPLAINTKKLFDLAGCTEYLDNSVKTNCFFFATTDEKELYKLLSHLKYLNVYKKSENWLERIVALVEPEIIICEGKSAFDRYTKNRNCEVKKIENDYCYAKYGEIHIIGYRRIHSSIRKIEKVASLIKEKLTDNNK